MSAIALKLAAMAVSYLLPEVLDKVRAHWWGRLALWFAGRRRPENEALRERLLELEQLTAQQRQQLNAAEQAAVDHTTDANQPSEDLPSDTSAQA